MKTLYQTIERLFEKISEVVLLILGNSITFIIALATIVYWLTDRDFYTQEVRSMIRDIILSVTFISFFIIQKSFNRFSKLLHLKLNELVLSHEPASNKVIDAEEKTEEEITQLAKEYNRLVKAKKNIDE